MQKHSARSTSSKRAGARSLLLFLGAARHDRQTWQKAGASGAAALSVLPALGCRSAKKNAADRDHDRLRACRPIAIDDARTCSDCVAHHEGGWLSWRTAPAGVDPFTEGVGDDCKIYVDNAVEDDALGARAAIA